MNSTHVRILGATIQKSKLYRKDMTQEQLQTRIPSDDLVVQEGVYPLLKESRRKFYEVALAETLVRDAQNKGLILKSDVLFEDGASHFRAVVMTIPKSLVARNKHYDLQVKKLDPEKVKKLLVEELSLWNLRATEVV